MTVTPASIRNRNPGAQEPGPSSKKFGSDSYETLKWRGPDGKPKTNRIATFGTSEHGAAAMFDLMDRKYTGVSLKCAVAKWCGGYWADEYASKVEAASHLKADDVLTKEAVRNPAIAIPIAKAMARMEAGRDYPMDQAGWESGHRMAFREVWAPAPTPDNDVPFPKPEAIAREKMETAVRKGWMATIMASIGGGATHMATNGVPPPPSAVTNSISNVGAWKGLVGTVATSPTLTAAAVFLGALAALHFVPKLLRK